MKPVTQYLTAVFELRPSRRKAAEVRKFDAACLTPVRQLSPEEIRSLREREGASQAVFARYLNVTTGLVSQWERGEKHPQGSSLKLLALVARHGLSTVA